MSIFYPRRMGRCSNTQEIPAGIPDGMCCIIQSVFARLSSPSGKKESGGAFISPYTAVYSYYISH
ncbi:hypothetical protein [Paenibacillus mesotrionivorans]|uniref:Uncharacterized protein n=1 Tax=Paenibacillus mesotrionivorans TaxID=3160968 RepID=A0ACC7NZT8_9BACL